MLKWVTIITNYLREVLWGLNTLISEGNLPGGGVAGSSSRDSNLQVDAWSRREEGRELYIFGFKDLNQAYLLCFQIFAYCRDFCHMLF